MFRIACAVAAVLVAAAGFNMLSARATTLPDGPAVGVISSKALVVAYYNSDLFDQKLADLKRRHQEQAAAGNKAEVEKLAGQGAALQERAHRQLAGDADLREILEDLRPAVFPATARRAGVSLIVLDSPAHVEPGVRVVDITEALVDELRLPEKGRRWVRELR